VPKELNFIFSLSPDLEDRIRISAFKEKKKIIKFVVQYESFIRQKWRPIIRYDTSHGFAHKDIIHPNGKEEKQPLYFPNYTTAFTFAIQDLKISWQWYKNGYEEELKNAKEK